MGRSSIPTENKQVMQSMEKRKHRTHSENNARALLENKKNLKVNLILYLRGKLNSKKELKSDLP